MHGGRASGTRWCSLGHCEGDVGGGFLHPWVHPAYSLPGQDSRGDLSAPQVDTL